MEACGDLNFTSKQMHLYFSPNSQTSQIMSSEILLIDF